MEPSDSSEVAPVSRGEWRSAGTMNGPQCVMTSGTMQMPKWCADNWDSLQMVRI
jgi:hypothetical protein